MNTYPLLSDLPNKNGRIYPPSVQFKVLDQLKQFIQERRCFIGNYTCEPDKMPTVTIRRTTHLAIGAKVVLDPNLGSLLVVSLEELQVPHAKELTALLRAGVRLLRASGYGTSTKNAQGHDVVSDDYVLDSISIVPATEAA